ncbi:class I SAM-dependent methyltransferase [Synoicihabitans lomoniglobus]|uniref:Class I SAM-dependent methyltransferase n=1 Tax=Synoicihabitans lomoniglobus TaxID=2909285 RepID=A0AAF0I865_9BACT|nr:class I SAM-dependent methyltransferase [Opitutaceae bacterium LMO-M01]WED67381.1 class I SAM-dependent methyltransferase [Opitutaceae bacterium LMO-M01]
MPLYDFSNLTIDKTISPLDTMIVPGRKEQYFEIGHRALELVEFAARLCEKPHFPNILDFGCGYARVLRWLRPRHHYAEITACELEQEAIDFSALHWGAIPVRSHRDISRIKFDRKFDLVWCGSVLTHLDLPQWEQTLDMLIDATNECGVIILTLQGRFFASALANKQRYVADDVDQTSLLDDFKRNGFAYQKYFDRPDYGITLSAPEWVTRLISKRTNVILRSYIEESWGMQDVVILYKAENYFAKVL